jgi:hypothetical protein
MAATPKMTLGNPELAPTIGIQRGQWKHQYQKRHTFRGVLTNKLGDTYKYHDPVNENLNRRRQVSSWCVTLQTNKRAREDVSFKSQQNYGKAYKRRGGTELVPHWDARVRGSEYVGGSKKTDKAARQKVPQGFKDILSHEDAVSRKMLREVVELCRSDPNAHPQMFSFGSGIDQARSRSDIARTTGKYKKLRQPAHVGAMFANDIALLPPYADDLHHYVFESLEVSDYTIEYGKDSKCMHCHFYLNVVHYSQIQIDVHKFPQVLRRLWNAQCTKEGMEHLQYEGYNPKTKRLRAPHVWVQLQHETVSKQGVKIHEGNKYGNKDAEGNNKEATFRDSADYVGVAKPAKK